MFLNHQSYTRNLASFLIVLFVLAIMSVVPVTRTEAATLISEPGNYMIQESDSVYQIDSGYSGTISVGDAVYKPDNVTITGSSSNIVHIVIPESRDTSLNLTIDNMKIDNTNDTSGFGIDIKTNQTVNLFIKGTCEIKSGSTRAIHVPAGKTIVIDHATNDNDTLRTTGGIGGYSVQYSDTAENGGSITINGACITDYTGTDFANIGGSRNGSGGYITINGGQVTCTSNSGGHACIGGGYNGSGGSITINGGQVEVRASSGGAGIGGGSAGTGSSTNGGNIRITGGTVIANGGIDGAGIGGGSKSSGGNITITGGTVTATGGNNGAGIGCGSNDNNGTLPISGGTINISGGTVKAEGGTNQYGGAGIGGGYKSNGGNISITGGNITATGGFGSTGYGGAGIGGGGYGGDGGSINISAGNVTAISGQGGAGIGGGSCGSGANVIITDNPAIIATGILGEHVGKGQGALNSGILKNSNNEALSYLRFQVTNGANDVNGATVTMGGHDFLTNANGLTGCMVLQSSESSPYTVTAAGYRPHVGLAAPSAMNVGVNVNMNSGCSITYDGNTNTGGVVPTDNNNYDVNATVTVSGNTGNLVKSGFGFAGWNTVQDGSGTAYPANGTFAMGNANVTLYAQWAPVYTVTYNDNGSTGGSVPTDSNQYFQNDPVTVSGNTGNLVKSGFGFTGWNTQADGSGTAYSDGSTFAMGNANVTLYAQWAPVYTVTYNDNGSTGGSVPADGNNYFQNAPVTVSGNTGNLVKSGFGFTGWNTQADGSGTAYSDGSTFAMVTLNVTLYAQWAPTYTVSYDSNGSTSGSVPMDSNKYTEGSTVTVIGNTGGLSKAGYTFGGWSYGSVTGAVYMPGSTFGMPAYDIVLSAVWNAVQANTYTVTFKDWDGSTLKTETVNEGTRATAPANPTRAGYTFTGWDKSFSNVTSNLTVTAQYSYSGGNNGSGSGGGGGGSSPSNGSSIPTTSDHTADVIAGDGSEATLPVTINKDSGTASIDVSAQSFVQNETVITIPSIPDVNALTVRAEAGSITVPSNMLIGVSGISGSKAQISIGQGDKSTLPANVKAAIGGKPLIQLTLSIDGTQTNWSNADVPVTVSIPYTPTAEELLNPESIVIWYIDGSGNAVSMPNGHYDSATGRVTFSTTHFSLYAVGYNKVSFNDVAASAWYKKTVNFIAARGITGGTCNGNYSLDATLTRGEVLVMLMKAYGIAPDTDLIDNFTDAGNTYYTGYLAAAKRLGITAGVGNNQYTPGKQITRQEMFTLLYNALKVIGQLPQGDSGKTLSDFADAGQIDFWAKDAITPLIETGTVSGSNGSLSPLNTTSRAEMAQVLFNLLAK